jgi:hypothetical protein
MFMAGMLALLLTFGLVLAGCFGLGNGDDDDKDGGNDGGVRELPGTIYISSGSQAYTKAILGQKLYAFCTDVSSGAVTFQWNKDGTAISNASSEIYTPVEAGSYTVTMSASGYQDKTSAPFSVVAAITPQDFEGSYGDETIITVDRESRTRTVISDVTDTGATLVYARKRYIDDYETYTVTCNITWGSALEKVIDENGFVFVGFGISGTSELTSGNWEHLSFKETEIFGSAAGTMPSGIKIGFQIDSSGNYQLRLCPDSVSHSTRELADYCYAGFKRFD